MNWCLLRGVVSCFEFLSCAVMASDTDDNAVTEFTEENVEQTGLSRVEKKKETDILLPQITKRKRTGKTKVTKLRHELERVCLKDSELPVIESVIEQLWTALEKVEETLEELTAFYVEVGDEYGKKEAIEESETIEKEGVSVKCRPDGGGWRMADRKMRMENCG